jgi:diguanylate cyclase (GGDEF)-like protein/PAS domain S-box-containing protein
MKSDSWGSFSARAALSAGVAGTWLLFLLFNQGSDSARLVSNLGLITAPLAASLACASAARRSSGGARRAWALFAASSAAWGLGQTTWTLYETVFGRRVPFPSLADVGYLGAVPLAIAALVSMPNASRTAASRVRMVLDGMVTASSLLVVSWAVVLGPLFDAGGGAVVDQVIALAYPVGDVVMITMALSFVGQSWHGSTLPLRTLVLISGALVALAVADSGFTYLTTKELYSSGHPIDGGWFLGYTLLFLAARSGLPGPGEAGDRELPRRAAAATPYLAVLCAVATAAALQVVTGTVEAFVIWGLVLTMLLLVARQYMSILENHSLARTLEERVRARTAEVRRSEERFRSLVQNSSDVVTILEPDGTIRYQSPAVEPVLGYEPDLLVGTVFADLVHPDEVQVFLDGIDTAVSRPEGTSLVEVGLLHRDGRWRRSETAVTNLLKEPNVGGVVLNTRDVSERKQLEEQLLHQAFHDALTGLANGTLFRNRLDHALAQRRRRHVAVLFCDLDGFKRVNDSLGHSAGDALLTEIAIRIRSSVRPGDTVARLGGDEFAVLLEDVMFEAEANVVAKRLGEALRRPITIAGRELFVSMSIGIAVAESETDGAETLLRNADLAMYRAKSQGLGGYERFDGRMLRAADDRIGLETDLHRAVSRNELELHYQPIIELHTGRVVGLEALIRWNHPTRGSVPPNEFIPLAEWSALIVEIGRWVLQEACRQMKAWEGFWPGGARGFVSVNLSARQVLHPGLATDVAIALDRSGLDPSQLVLEMTESVLLEHNEETVNVLHLLKDLGVRLAVDDFGTGYSSLSYLHRFPFDTLKIDRSFIQGLSSERSERSLAASIVRIGRALDLEMVAEGIEGSDQLLALREMGCERGQGYYFARPLPKDQVEAFLHRPSQLVLQP